MTECKISCPVCNSNSTIIKELNSDFIKKEIEKYYNEKLIDSLTLINYEICKCSYCSLEFASPMQPGSDNFYTWITNHKGYYPDHRWEWQEVINQIRNQNVISASLLEVGCGTGKFLELAKKSGSSVLVMPN